MRLSLCPTVRHECPYLWEIRNINKLKHILRLFGELIISQKLQDSAESWYAYKDLCSAPRSSSANVCQYFGSWYTSKCDSTGVNAFPNPMPCSCPGGGDKNSGSRIWGGTAGKAFYNPETGRVQKGGKFSKPYSQTKAKKLTGKMTLPKYESYIKSLGCHGN